MKRNGLTVMRQLIGLVKPLSGRMVLAILMGLAGHLCASFITIFGGFAILNLLGIDMTFQLSHIFLVVLIFALLRAGLRYAEQASNHYIAFSLLALIRDRVFSSLRRLAPAKLEGKDKGDLIAVITSDIEMLEVFYAHTISPAAIAALFTLFMTVFIARYHLALAAILLIAHVIVGIVIPFAITKISGDIGLRFRNKAGSLSAYMLDSLRGLSEIQQYGQGQQRLARMNAQSDALSQDEARMKQISAWNTAITNTVILLASISILTLSIWLYQQGSIGFDGVLIPTISLMGSFGPVVALAALGSTLQHTFAAGNRVLDLLEEEAVTKDVSGKVKTDFSSAQASDLSFAYDGELVLDELSIDFPFGKIVGISGKSGSGKSTLLKLLMRFWTVDRGALRISDKDINEINTADLRDMESYMTQETYLFQDSIRNNLKIAKLDASDEEIVEACKKAAIHDFISSLPEGYDTAVGELGETLSGGERQRLGLARVFLHDAAFVLLDEPTSNLDSLNEAVILKALADSSADKTVVLVSHRQSTMRIADDVYSVENGRMS